MKQSKFSVFAFLLLIGCAVCAPIASQAQIEGLYVERYYVADANDASDTTGGRSIEEGAITYRVFLDLASTSKLKKIYGDFYHPLKIQSTGTIYNNIDRPDKNFGYLINKAWLDNNPTIALDSWLTLGLGLTAYLGVPKDSDTDGSFVGGVLNYGGTAAIPGGILVNDDPSAGIPLTIQDGYAPNTQTLGQWLDQGFEDIISGDDTTTFGPLTIGTELVSYGAYLQQNNGVQGADSTNMVLVAQITTNGDLTFELNVEVEQFDGINTTIVSYVANADTLLPGEIISPFLKYPSVCGCNDPNYLEYNPAYACNIQDSCIHPIVFGCMDPMACNYDPSANYNVQELCCYPGLCNDRDLQEVCPEISNGRISIEGIYPVPVSNEININIRTIVDQDLSVSIIDMTGRILMHENLGKQDGFISYSKNLEELPSGIYLLRIISADQTDFKTFSKE